MKRQEWEASDNNTGLVGLVAGGLGFIKSKAVGIITAVVGLLTDATDYLGLFGREAKAFGEVESLMGKLRSFCQGMGESCYMIDMTITTPEYQPGENRTAYLQFVIKDKAGKETARVNAQELGATHNLSVGALDQVLNISDTDYQPYTPDGTSSD